MKLTSYNMFWLWINLLLGWCIIGGLLMSTSEAIPSNVPRRRDYYSSVSKRSQLLQSSRYKPPIANPGHHYDHHYPSGGDKNRSSHHNTNINDTHSGEGIPSNGTMNTTEQMISMMKRTNNDKVLTRRQIEEDEDEELLKLFDILEKNREHMNEDVHTRKRQDIEKGDEDPHNHPSQPLTTLMNSNISDSLSWIPQTRHIVDMDLMTTPDSLPELLRYVRQHFVISKDIARNMRDFIPELTMIRNRRNDEEGEDETLLKIDIEETSNKSSNCTSKPCESLKDDDDDEIESLGRKNSEEFVSEIFLDYGSIIRKNPPVAVNMQHMPGSQLMARSLHSNRMMTTHRR